MNVGEYGTVVNVQTGFDMSSNTKLQVQFRKPDNRTLTQDAVLGTMTFTDPVSGITFTANEYAVYEVEQGDIDQGGVWSVKVLYTDAVQFLPSNYTTFTVGL